MEHDKDAAAARSRLGVEAVLANHLYCLTAAVRALIATHPDGDRMRLVFDQLVGQMLAQPGFLDDPDKGVVLRNFAEVLFQPPVEL